MRNDSWFGICSSVAAVVLLCGTATASTDKNGRPLMLVGPPAPSSLSDGGGPAGTSKSVVGVEALPAIGAIGGFGQNAPTDRTLGTGQAQQVGAAGQPATGAIDVTGQNAPTVREPGSGETLAGVDCVCDGAFSEGDRVVALVNNPQGAAGILAGHEGTVICGTGGFPPLLIMWDEWAQGHDGNGFCSCPVTSAPAGTAWYVDCSDVELAGLCTCVDQFEIGDRVVAAVDNPQGASGILAGRLGTVICGDDVDPLPLLISWDDWADGHDGNGFCLCPVTSAPAGTAWWIQCEDVHLAALCDCENQYQVGDRVRAIVDNPEGATGILKGRRGTVICGDDVDPLPLLVSWDDWLDGHDGNGFCLCPVTSAPADTAWWIQCDAVEPLPTSVPADCDCDAIYFTGDRVVAEVDNPQGASGILAGHHGTVICGDDVDPLPLLISWDDWAQGHDGNGFCLCPVTSAPPGTAWWVDCPTVSLLPSCPQDANHDGFISFADLLILLANWGECVDPCGQDVDHDGAITFADLLSLLGAWGPCGG